ncbi:hypothetical protein [Nocardia sp. MW-W600-9]
MTITPGTICTNRDCTNPATHLYEFTNHVNQPSSKARCEPCYTRARHIDENLDRWLGNYLSR